MVSKETKQDDPETEPVRRRGDRRVAELAVTAERRKGDRRDLPGIRALFRTLFRGGPGSES